MPVIVHLLMVHKEQVMEYLTISNTRIVDLCDDRDD